MGIENQNYNGRGNGYEGLSANDGIWDATLEVISEQERIRYRIYERYAQLNPGDVFDIETVFGKDGVSADEYVEFLDFNGRLSNPFPSYASQEELDRTIAEVKEGEAGTMYMIANTLLAEGDAEEAVKWYSKASELGYSDSICRLAGAYKYGHGIEMDMNNALLLYKKAIATDGNVDALLDLGLCYLKGEGVPVDYKRGFFLMERSAKQGNMMAQYNLGTLYRIGGGVEPDIDEALRWYRLSAAQGYEQAVDFLERFENEKR